MSFKIVSKFREAAGSINTIPADKFLVLLGRIIQRLHNKSARFFSDEEEEQLRAMFGFSAAELKTALDCCSYIFEQAAFSSTGPEPLFELLLEAGFDEAHAKAIGRTWASEAGEYIAKLKQAQTMGFPSSSSLVASDYHLNMVLGQAGLSKQQEPTALFELSLKEGQSNANNTGSGGDSVAGTETEKFVVEFNHEELYAFFSQLERVQKQLDALGSTS